MLFRFLGFFILAWVVSVPCLYASQCPYCQYASYPGTFQQAGYNFNQSSANYSDAQLTSNIRQKFETFSWWDTSSVAFVVKHGKVIVRGVVSSFEQYDNIEDKLNEVKGISAIDNKVEIKTGTSVSRWNRRDFR